MIDQLEAFAQVQFPIIIFRKRAVKSGNRRCEVTAVKETAPGKK